MSANASYRLSFDLPETGEGLCAEFARGRAAPCVLQQSQYTVPPYASAASVAALPPGRALLVPLSPPPLPEGKLRAILPSLLSAQLPFPLNSCQFCFEKAAPGKYFAHVVRTQDLRARIDRLREAFSCEPAAIVPPAPVLWKYACASTFSAGPQSAEPRALFWMDSEQTLLVTGFGNTLKSVSVFRTPEENPAELLRRLRLAFSDAPDAAPQILVAGKEAAAVAGALASAGQGLRVSCAAEPSSFLLRALLQKGVCAYNLRLGEAAPPQAFQRLRTRATIASFAFFCCSALALASSALLLRQESAFRRLAQNRRSQELRKLAGFPVTARGAQALEIARAEARKSFRPEIFELETPSRAFSRLTDEARAAGIVFSHLRLDASGLQASGTAPSQSALNGFLQALRKANIPARTDGTAQVKESGAVSFLIIPSAGGADK